MVGWIDEDGIPRGGFSDKITPVREQLKERLKSREFKPTIVVENPQPYLEPDVEIPEPEVKS